MSVMSQDKTRPEKALKTDHPEGAPVTLKSFYNGDNEAYWIAKEIKRQIAYSGNKLKYEDFVILLRFNALSRTIESQLNRMRIPVRVLAGTKFFDRVEIKDIMCYLTLLLNPQQTLALRRAINVPKRGMGPKSVDDIISIAQKAEVAPFTMLLNGIVNDDQVRGWKPSWKKLDAFVDPLDEVRTSLRNGKPLKEIVERLIKDIKYEAHLRSSCQSEGELNSRLENLKELLSFAAVIDADANEGNLFKPDEEFDSVKDQNFARLGKFLEVSTLDVSFNTEADADEKLGKVTISTIHSAKGLEWPVVFLPAVESGVIPFFKADTEEEMREERRLLYVGMTRAQAVLNVSYAGARMVAGSMKDRSLSEFLRYVKKEECYQDDAMLIDDKLRAQMLSILGLEQPDAKEITAAIKQYEDTFKADRAMDKAMSRGGRRSYGYRGSGLYDSEGEDDDDDSDDPYGYSSKYGRSSRGYGFDYSDRIPKKASSSKVKPQPSFEMLSNPFTTGSGGSLTTLGGSAGASASGSNGADIKYKVSQAKPFKAPRPAAPPSAPPASKEVKADVAASDGRMKSYRGDSDVNVVERNLDSKPTNLQSFQQGADTWKDSLKILLKDDGNLEDVKPAKRARRD
ncbi:hypothetical protein E3P99_03169 [Wallemia hederae]|uniref:UvrD-like helicase C-terminal domain-containing protein n=1 Tax=Wallemia hederae TaxID=1540922 RepID=A0A4T0FHP2_9BASI|nr:hypothetical protein E3P99_03169 [Wallemia hederae]